MHAAAHPDRFRREVPDEAVARAFAAAIEAPSSYWVVAEEEGETVGFLSAEFREREESWHSVARRGCYLAGIAVAPRFRRTGIARALVADLRREAAARGVGCVELDVWAFNEVALQMFSRLGFRGVMQRMALPVEEPTKTPGPRRRKGTEQA